MIPLFLAQNIIYAKERKTGYTFAKVPEVFKPQVKQILEDSGLGHLAVED